MRALTEGELWAREAVAELRAAGYTPPAVMHFLGASARRAEEQRRARPELARQARRWGLVGAWAWIVPALAGARPLQERIYAGLAWWAFVALMLEWHLGMVESEGGEARPLGPADACTLTRAWLVPLAAERPTPAVCAAGFASDAIDGALSRRAVPTRAGRDFDGLVDIAFTAAALRGAVRQGWLGRVPAAAEGGRLMAGAALGVAAYFRSGRQGVSGGRRARGAAVARAGGLLAAGLGHRRAANALVGIGTIAGVQTRAAL